MTTFSSSMLLVFSAAAAGLWGTLGGGSDQEGEGGAPRADVSTADETALQGEQAKAQLVEAMAQAGIHMDLEAGIVSIPATVQVREELLEYALCTPRGQAHESLFLTEVSPTALNAALLALGLEPGKNARLVARDVAVGEGEAKPGGGPGAGELSKAAASRAPDVIAPEGDALFLYVAWREEGELYFYRVDDLIANLDTGRTLRRHAWVFLGSRMVQPRTRVGEQPRPEVFAAELEGNLINISFFFGGNTLLTAARPECVHQSLWVGNGWLLPPRSSPVEFFFSREQLETVPKSWREALPMVKRSPVDAGSTR